MKQYIGLSRDHSGSMGSIARAAARDYNATIAGIRAAAEKEKIDTIVTVMSCGIMDEKTHRTVNRPEAKNSSITVLEPLAESDYKANGSETPLFDSIGDLIVLMKQVPDANDPDVAFLVQVTTDGEDNASRKWNGRSLAEEMKRLQATDRWTFTFRVPRGYARQLTNLGIPGGNIIEWDQTERGVAVTTQATQQGYANYFQGRSKGVRSTNTFYTDLKDVKVSDIKATLDDVTKQVNFWSVNTLAEGASIRGFCQLKLGRGQDMKKGSAFYMLTKPEAVQDYKIIAIVDKKTGSVYSGLGARDLLGLPHYGEAKVAPGDHGQYDIFVQSTSVNRKLPVGTKVMYWDSIGVSFKS